MWEALGQVLMALDKLLIQVPKVRKHFAAFAASLVKPAAARVGWDARPDDGHLGKLLRATLVNLLSLFCWSELEVLQEARRRFDRICQVRWDGCKCIDDSMHFQILIDARSPYDKRAQQDPGDVEALPTEYKVPVLAMVLKAGGQKEFDQVMQLYHDAPSNVEKKQVRACGHAVFGRMSVYGGMAMILINLETHGRTGVQRHRLHGRPGPEAARAGVGAVGDQAAGLLLPHRLRLCLEVRPSPPHDSRPNAIPLAHLSPVLPPPRSHEGLELAWAFYQERFPEFRQKLATASPSLMDAVIVYSCGSFASEDKANEIEAFFAQNPLPSSARKIAQTLERIRINARFVDRLKHEIGSTAFWKELNAGYGGGVCSLCTYH